MKRTLPLSRVYRLLEPGPVVLVTTARKGRANVMTLSWHTMMEFEPPLVGCVISNRNHTFNILKATKECVINIPTVELAKKVVGCGNTSGRSVDKFETFRLTPAPASRVAAPLIDECYVNLECRVVDTKLSCGSTNNSRALTYVCQLPRASLRQAVRSSIFYSVVTHEDTSSEIHSDGHAHGRICDSNES